ncbi:MAG: acyltransferase [Sphingomonadales bacterium]|nr:acyltransferase [Sphingomonadales bacterium]
MQTYLSIQYLRAIAAMMVVMLHSFSTGTIGFSADIGWLRGGVDIFFVISGFIMVKSAQGRDDRPVDFWLRRIIRIVPIYWLATYVAMLFFDWNMEQLLKSFFFISYYNPEAQGYMPILQPGWTVNYEMFFYLLFGFSLLVPDRYRLFLLTFILTALVILGAVFELQGVAGFYTRPMMLEFCAGMAIAKWQPKLPLWLIPAAAIAMVMFWYLELPREIRLGIPAVLLVAAAVSAEAYMPKIRSLMLLGDASYAVYLFHLITLSVVGKMCAVLEFGYAQTFFACIVASCITGIAIHLGIEKPVTIWLQRMAFRRSPQPAVT